MKLRNIKIIMLGLTVLSMMAFTSSAQLLSGGGGGGTAYFYYTVSGTVRNSYGCVLPDVTISISGGSMSGSDETNSNGYFLIEVRRTTSGSVTFNLESDISYIESGDSVSVATNGHSSVSVTIFSGSRVGVQSPDPSC